MLHCCWRGSRISHHVSYLLQDRIIERLKQLAGPLIDLPPREETVRKFSNHCRLWVGNLPLDIKEDDVKELFKPFGEYDEVYFDKNKGFAFVRMVSIEALPCYWSYFRNREL